MLESRFARLAGGFVLAACAAAVAAAPATAQERGAVSGVVRDANSLQPLESVQVFVEGTEIGTLTDRDGQFRLTGVPAGEATVTARLIGYRAASAAVTVRAGQAAQVTLELTRSAVQLDEIVVTGQGRATELRRLPTTVDVVSTETIESSGATSIGELLQGQIAGGTVDMVSAQPGTGPNINFRGITSVFGSQTPVIYIDGVRVDNDSRTSPWSGGEYSSALSELLVSDIERIEITKGGAASTLYGSDAAAGVIQIFTAKGDPGAPRVQLQVEQGVHVPELKYIFDTEVIWPDLVENGTVPPDFMEKRYFKDGSLQNYHASVSGGSSDFTYDFSGRTQHSSGVQPKNSQTIFNLRGGVRAQVSDALQLDFSSHFTRTNHERLYNGTAIADPLTTFEVGDALFFSGAETLERALEIFLMPDIGESVNRITFSSGANYSVSDAFTSQLKVGVDYRSNQERQFQPIGFTPGEVEGELQRFQREHTTVTLDYSGTVSWPRDGDLTSDLTFGVQGFREEESVVMAEGTGFALPGSKDFDEAATIDAFEDNSELFNGGLYVQEQLGLMDRLFLNTGVRVDFSSAFGEEVDFEAYPKAGASYLLSRESFFRDAVGDVVNELRLRVAYGQTGKFPKPFQRDRTFEAVSFRGQSAPRFENPGNPELGPEVTETIEGGADLALFHDRIGVSVTYYDATTREALFSVPEQPVTGQGLQFRNVGRLENSGWELQWNVRVLDLDELRWALNGTFQTKDNVVADMGGAAPFFVGGTDQRVAEGKRVGAWFVTTPVDTNGDGKLDGSERQYTGGQPWPTKNGSLGTDVTLFQRLTLSALGEWATGSQVMDWGSVWATFNSIYRRERIAGVEFPVKYDLQGNEVGKYFPFDAISAFIYDGDYAKVRRVSARYNVPDSWVRKFGVQSARVYASARNLFIWSENQLVDPELSGVQSGSDLNLGGATSITLSPPKMFHLGVEVGL